MVLAQALRQKELSGQVNDVMDAAMASANMYGEVGVVLDFMKHANLSDTYQGVADAFFQALTRFEFEGCLRLIGHNGIISTTGAMQCKRWKSRFEPCAKSGSSLGLQNLGTNTVFNYGNVMVLVRNLLTRKQPDAPRPQREAERHGRARDNIAMLAEAAATQPESRPLTQRPRR